MPPADALIGMRVSPVPTSLRRTRTVGRDAFGADSASADLTEAWSSISILFRDSSADATQIPGEGQLAYHCGGLLQVVSAGQSLLEANAASPGSTRYTSPAVRHTAPHALVHNNENPR